jgi:hypothetical protein
MCLTTVLGTHRTLIAGMIICFLGFVLMLTFSGQDILTPGFNQNGLVIQDTEVKPHESIIGSVHIDKISGPVTLMLSSVNNPIVFDIQIETPDNLIIHREYLNGRLDFVPTTSGDYIISVKNLSLRSTVLRMSYGSTVDEDNSVTFYTTLWMGLIIGGNYLIIHSRYVNERHPTN